MNTPAHLIIGMAAFARPDDRRVTTAAVAGSLLPDLSIYAMVAWQGLVRGRTEQEIFQVDYVSAFWQSLFAVDNSIPLWAGALALGLVLARPWLWALGGAGLLHVVIDLLVHNSDARRHFWPISDWVFRSPVSYWEAERYGRLVGTLEIMVVFALSWWLWRRFPGGRARALIVAVVSLEAIPAFIFPILFASH